MESYSDMANELTGGSPITDPTLLTTEALQREIQHLRELLEAADSRLNSLISLHVENIQQQMQEADLRYQQRYDAQSKALDDARLSAEREVQSALAAAEKAVSKAEVAAEKRFDTVSEKVDDAKNITFQQIAAIQSQLASMVGHGAGGVAVWGYVAAGIFLLIAIITFISNQGAG